jgi:hypothetical protein
VGPGAGGSHVTTKTRTRTGARTYDQDTSSHSSIDVVITGYLLQSTARPSVSNNTHELVSLEKTPISVEFSNWQPGESVCALDFGVDIALATHGQPWWMRYE